MSWQRIQGHDRVIAGLKHVAQKGRLAHAYLLLGPDGVGKKLLATELARAFLCENPPDLLTACDRCEACVLVSAGTHPDFHTLTRPEDKNEIPIDAMRAVIDSLGLKSGRGRGKVALIENTDDFNDASTNCFLKTLEEPYPGSLLLLTGVNKDLQYPTILSRCQVLRLAPLPADLVMQIARGQGVEPGLLAKTAALAGGSPGVAVALADPELWAFRQKLLGGLCGDKPDTIALAKSWMEFAEDAGKEASAQRRRILLTLKLVLAFFTDALAVSLGGSARTSDLEDQRMLNALVSRTGPDKISGWLERCLQAETQLGRYIQSSLVVEGLLEAYARTMR